MKRILRWGAFALIGTLLLTYFLIDLKSFGPSIIANIKTSANSQGVFVEIGAARPYFFGLEFNDVYLGPLRAPFRFAVKTANIKSSLISLLRSEPQISANAQIYSGQLTADLQLTTSRFSLSGEGNLRGLELKEHPQLNGLGITAGVLGLSFKDLLIDERGILRGSATLTVRDADKPRATEFRIKLVGGEMPATIPAWHAINLDANAIFSAKDVRFSSIVLTSSLINLSGDASLTLPSPGGRPSLRADLKVNLSAEGQSELGPFLILIDGGSSLASANQFRLSLSSGSGNSIKAHVSPIS